MSAAAVGAPLLGSVTASRVAGRRVLFDTRVVLDDGSGAVGPSPLTTSSGSPATSDVLRAHGVPPRAAHRADPG